VNIRGKKSDEIATKFRKGACENCGAMTHKTKDCFERPRKHGAKVTGKDIARDELY
jgi:pre-mRNA-processing factor SLU7